MSVKHFFLDGNTSEGFYSLSHEVLSGIENIHIITGSIDRAKTRLFSLVGDLYSKDHVVYFLHNPSDEEKLDGVIIPNKNLAFLDGSTRHHTACKYYGLVSSTFSLDQFLRYNDLKTYKKEIIKLVNKYDQLHKEAYRSFFNGKQIHEKKEELFISAMDFEKANKVTNELIKKIFTDVTGTKEQGMIKQLFFGAATPSGPVNYIDDITEGIGKRYIIKGRSGSGKSTVMRKIGKHAEELGLSVQYFPCGLDPNSLDMVIIPSLETVILDGTAPHVINPTRVADEIVDMFELCMDKTIEAKYANEFKQLDFAYKKKMKEGTQSLNKAKEIKSLITNYYESAIDLDLLNEQITEYVNKFK